MTTEMESAATERVLTALEGVRPSGDGWQALCPAHDDHNPSLSIRHSGDRVLLHCHAGCETAAVLAGAGLQFPHLFDRPQSGGGEKVQIGPDGEVEWMPRGFTFVDYYNYTVEGGTLNFQVLRGLDGKRKKTFRQRRPDRSARSQWTWNLDDLSSEQREIPYLLPQVLAAKERGETIWVVEGEKDAEALGGVGISATCNAGGAGKWTDQHSSYLRGADVVIVADKDKPGYAHAAKVVQSLEGCAASVRVVEAAEGKDAADHLAAGRTLDDFVDVTLDDSTDEEETGPAVTTGGREREWYETTPTGLFLAQFHKNDGDPYTTRTRLTNFAAIITASTEVDDGVEIERALEIEATVAGRTRRCSIPSSAFTRMEWVVPELGPQAIVLPQCKDRTRAAIQTLSDPVEIRQYAQTGWRTVEGQPVYLHAGGGIGSSGPVEDVQVDLAGSLANYLLPAPGGVESIRASLKVLDCAPDRITIPLLAAVYRAPLGGADSALSLFGSTGLGKSELAALAQQHYGAGLDARNLPASWSATANALEETAFRAADALLVVDDFCPTGTQNDVARLHMTADRLIRNAANGAGRARMTKEGGLRATRPPRALILSTGEAQVRGESLRARTLPLGLEAGQVNWPALGASQVDAAGGLFAASLAGYLSWLAGRMDAVRVARVARVNELRALATQGAHKRTAAATSSFLWGWEMFLAYAESTTAIDTAEADALWERGWTAMEEASAAASAGVGESDPAARFLILLNSAIGSGCAHVAGLNGKAPTEARRAWGWRGEDQWVAPMGQRVGWVDGDDLYLDSDAAYRAAQAAGEGLVVDVDALRQRLREAGLLASVDEGRTPTLLTVRKVVEGKRRRVLHLRSDALSEGDHLGDHRVTTGDHAVVTRGHPRVTWVTTAKRVSDQVKQSVIVDGSPRSPKTLCTTWLASSVPDMAGMFDTADPKGSQAPAVTPEKPAVTPSLHTHTDLGDPGDHAVSGTQADPESPDARPTRTQHWEDTSDPSPAALDGLDHDPWDDRSTGLSAPVIVKKSADSPTGSTRVDKAPTELVPNNVPGHRPAPPRLCHTCGIPISAELPWVFCEVHLAEVHAENLANPF